MTIARKIPLLSLPMMLITSVVGGIGVGALLYLSSKLIYLILVSPIVAGLLASGLMYLAIEWSKLRSKAVVLVFGLLMGVLVYVTYHYGEYWQFQADAKESILAEDKLADDALVRKITNAYLRDETGQDGFAGFLLLEATEGMTISSTRSYSSTDSGLNVGKWGTYAIWLVETGIIAGIIVNSGFSRVETPFCSDKNEWLQWQLRGRVTHQNMNQFMNLVKQGYFSQAGSLITTQGVAEPYLAIHMGRCEEYSPEGFLRVQLKNGNKTKQLLLQTIDSLQYDALNGVSAS